MTSATGARRVAVAAVCAILCALLSTTTSTQVAGATPSGAHWGAYPSPRGTETDQEAVVRYEKAVGRPLGVVRDYLLWNSPFPDTFHNWLADSGRTMILSVRAIRTDYKTVVPWADIAAAQPGDPLYRDMVAWADRLGALGVPVYFSFNHEPETVHNLEMGTAPEFIAAWRRFHDIFRERGVTNVRFMWIMTDFAFFASPTDRRRAEKWYPGDSYVDAVAADAYNWFTCRAEYKSPWRSLESIIAPFRDFGLQHPGEELWLAEWGTVEDPAVPGRKAQWISDARELFKRSDYAQFHGVAYFDSYKHPTCHWPVETSSSSLSAFAAMGADVFYGGAGAQPPQSKVAFVDSVNRHGYQSNHAVRVPTSVSAGDAMVLFFASGANASTTPPSGWQVLESVDPTGMRGRAWGRIATAEDAGSVVEVRSSTATKGDLTLAVYRGAAGSALDVSGLHVDTSTTATHLAPSVTPSAAGGRVIVYWADKSVSNTGHDTPSALARRGTASGSGSGHVTATLADTVWGDAGAPTPRWAAVGTATAGRAVAFVVAVRPT